jgi:hypothetical protein
MKVRVTLFEPIHYAEGEKFYKHVEKTFRDAGMFVRGDHMHETIEVEVDAMTVLPESPVGRATSHVVFEKMKRNDLEVVELDLDGTIDAISLFDPTNS